MKFGILRNKRRVLAAPQGARHPKFSAEKVRLSTAERNRGMKFEDLRNKRRGFAAPQGARHPKFSVEKVSFSSVE